MDSTQRILFSQQQLLFLAISQVDNNEMRERLREDAKKITAQIELATGVSMAIPQREPRIIGRTRRSVTL